ncbi:hypothetical protein Tco_1218611, partial [Tanacetum coccineum]
MGVLHFLYGTIDEVYVMQPPGFQDPDFPDRVYKVEKEAQRRILAGISRKDVIFLSQDKYVGDILKKFGYTDVRIATTPMDRENPWGKDGSGKDVDLHLYRSMIGSLMYLTASRPNIMFVVCVCARHQVTPKECHLHAVKRIFRYLKGHPTLGLWYPKESPFDLVAYSDSDYDGDNHDRTSTTGGYDNVADLLTKPYDVGRFQYLVVKHVMESSFWCMKDGITTSVLCLYALEVCPTVYVSHIKQFWSTPRTETADGETMILAKIDGKQRTIIESSIRKALQLNDEE